MSVEPSVEISGFLPPNQYLERRSPSLINNPQETLSETFEIDRYLHSLNPLYLEELNNINKLIKPMSEKCRLTIGIPAYGEGKYIYKTLELYTHQKDKNGKALNSDSFEIVIFDNHPSGVSKDNTQEEIERFIKKYPAMNVIYIHKQWGVTEEATAANARKYLGDLALLRNKRRKEHKANLILGYNDADAEEISDEYVEKIINAFDSDPNIDALTGKSVLPELAMNKPNILAATRFWGYMAIIAERGGSDNIRFKEPTGMVGRNMAIRSSMYAAVGGFNPKEKCADDLEMTWLISDARAWDPKRIIFLNKARITTNPRRHLAATATGIPIFNMYFDFNTHPEIRSMDNLQLLEKIPNNLDLPLLEQELDAWWQAQTTGEYAYLGNRFESVFGRAMSFLGVDYIIVENHIKITNADKLLNGLSTKLKRPVKTITNESKTERVGKQNETETYESGSVIKELRAKQLKLLTHRVKAAESGHEIVSGDIDKLEFLRKELIRFSS